MTNEKQRPTPDELTWAYKYLLCLIAGEEHCKQVDIPFQEIEHLRTELATIKKAVKEIGDELLADDSFDELGKDLVLIATEGKSSRNA